MQRNLLFLYLKTGGGHLSPAKALAEVIDNNYGDNFKPELVDGLAGAIKPAQWLIEDGYRASINYAKWIFEALYFFNKFDLVAQLSLKLFAPVAQKIIADKINSSNPAGIVIFHYFLIQPVFEVLKQMNRSIPVKVVVTDPFTAHPIWFLDKRPEFIVFSRQLKEQMLKNGFVPDKVKYFPQIVSTRFERLPDNYRKTQLMDSFGLSSSRKTVLIFGGGDGMKKGLPVFKRLLKSNVQHNIIMICGRNSLMQQMAQRLADASGKTGIKVFGFVYNVNELLALADVVVSKCGASAVAEIIITAKIPVIVDYIWEQEKGNLDFILDNQLGFYEPDAEKAVARINELITNPDKLEKYRRNIQSLKYENGVYRIAKFLVNSIKKSQHQKTLHAV
jgi:processive 1,2-diacylglycerol beta-glucosyltransferase/1,2-diacylglycerol 3-beta-galactosyltransferase